MSDSSRIYLDNAATSFPKPESVYAAVDRYNRELGVPIGRGAYKQAVEVQGIVDRCRKRAADLFGAESPDRIIFTFNCTDSLNLALQGLLRAGDHVVTSAIEHNSVLRPLRNLQLRFGVEATYVDADEAGHIERIQGDAKLQTVDDGLEWLDRATEVVRVPSIDRDWPPAKLDAVLGLCGRTSSGTRSFSPSASSGMSPLIGSRVQRTEPRDTPRRSSSQAAQPRSEWPLAWG